MLGLTYFCPISLLYSLNSNTKSFKKEINTGDVDQRSLQFYSSSYVTSYIFVVMEDKSVPGYRFYVDSFKTNCLDLSLFCACEFSLGFGKGDFRGCR